MSHPVWLDLAVLNPEQGPQQWPPARPGPRGWASSSGEGCEGLCVVQESALLLCDLRGMWEAGLYSLPGRS